MKNKSILNRVEGLFSHQNGNSINFFECVYNTYQLNTENIRDKLFHRIHLMNNKKNPGNEAEKENADIDQSGEKIADI